MLIQSQVQGASGRWYLLETDYAAETMIHVGRHVHDTLLVNSRQIVVCYNGDD